MYLLVQEIVIISRSLELEWEEESLRPTCEVFTKNRPEGVKIRQKTLLLDCQYWTVEPMSALYLQCLELGLTLRDVIITSCPTNLKRHLGGGGCAPLLPSPLGWVYAILYCQCLNHSLPLHTECLGMSIREIWILFLVLSLTFLLQLILYATCKWLPFISQIHGKINKM